MSQRDKRPSLHRTSFAGRHPELSRGTPVSLKKLQALRQSFDGVRDPLLKKQLEDLQKTESQRREETGGGSQMVKAHKPFPELRPRNDDSQIRRTFNQAWLREQRRETEAYLQQQEHAKKQEQELPQQKPQITQEPSR